ncbi:MAG: hypothetical protein OXI64_11995 [Defluviicoccus sp.]|nr:hypothetical protein [Defluviicoccus sp.]
MQRRSSAAIAVARLVGTTRTRTRRDHTSITNEDTPEIVGTAAGYLWTAAVE